MNSGVTYIKTEVVCIGIFMSKCKKEQKNGKLLYVSMTIRKFHGCRCSDEGLPQWLSRLLEVNCRALLNGTEEGN
jgi:hypothetical protein